MIPVIPKKFIDDLIIQKFLDSERIKKVISFVDEHKSKPMTRFASSGNVTQETLLKLFTQMLSCLNMKASESDVATIIESIYSSGGIEKKASKEINSSRKDEIKIVSRRVRDSHYQIDISKDIILSNNKKVFMVSCYARDAYLGQYLIKRNYYYTSDRQTSADAAYDEILTKMSALKDRYYNDIITVPAVSNQMKTILDGVISEIAFEEDNVSNRL